MTNFLPIFPLDNIIYPDETIHLTITEERYHQLISDCMAEEKPFGAPVVIEGKALEFGTQVAVISIRRNGDGSIDMVGKGLKVFRILEFVKDLPEKKYSGAIVHYPENDTMKVHPNLSRLIVSEVKRLYTLLNIETMLPEEDQVFSSYEIAHKLGLTREQEYELLGIFNEVQRMEYLRRYFNSIMPDIDNIDRIKSNFNLN
jgi:Lon protease-like protein